MLNIPEDVKTLFKRDDVFKNFHVHFPNGETTDLNNDNVVSESVTFTESLCSQQSFRFGLTEASEIQFTAVGIPNVRGATIECAIEICVDDLGAEWLANNAPTGTEDFLDPQVCVYGSRNMYRVPYGRFIVDTCPRNHESMWKREVTAYTERMDDPETMNPFQTAVMNAFYPKVDEYKPIVKPLALSVLAQSEADLLANGYVKTGIPSNGFGFPLPTKTLKKTGGATAKVRLQLRYNGNALPVANDITMALFRMDWGTFLQSDTIQTLATALERSSIDPEASGYDSFYELADDLLGKYYLPGFYYVFASSIDDFEYVAIPKGTNAVMYPYVAGVDSSGTYWGMQPGYLASISVYDVTTSTTEIIAQVANLPSVSFWGYTAGTDPLNVALNFSSTLQTTRKGLSGNVVKMYSFAKAFSLADLVQGYLELQCRFGSPARTGGMEVTALDNTTSTAVLPSDYASLWYDETTISPIGYVALKFKDETGEEQDLTVQIGTGASVYDLSDNEVLKNMAFTVSKSEAEAGTTIESKLLAFLNSVFTPNIPDLSFVPIELEKKGLPYFEAGDAVTITTGDGQTVPSFILRQTIKGIQFLQADVESANGEAVELIES